MGIVVGAVSDVGCKRTRNEDFLVVDPDLGLFAVIDGMGGHARGDLAARIIGETIHTTVAETRDPRNTSAFLFDPHVSHNANRMKAAVATADRALVSQIDADQQLQRMGATMAGVLVDGRQLIVANVGDCRGYLVRNGRIEQITVDHSLVAEQVRSGIIQPGDAKTHPLRNVVTRAICGGNEPVDVEIRELTLEPDDRVVICCDGLHGVVSDEELLRETQEDHGDPQVACHALVELAKTRGAPDNVTVIIIAQRESS